MSDNTIATSKLCVFRALLMCLLLLPVIAVSQGTYYNGIDTGSATFFTDLHNLIYPHAKISYDNFDETNVANFASRDTTSGQKAVTCVYSGENYLYTPPFAWGLFSREHTWCHSWMPTYSSTGGPEYSDQHHLFPTNQNNANGRRSNHPLGMVASIEYQYLEGKLGTNSSGQTVYEPRQSHKGDAARALFYMAVCYHGVNGNDWSFNFLNTVTLPGLSNPEAPQSVDVLMQWHTQDPPDDWEKARNEYIYSIQGNRNPFIDHPEYAGVIDFNTLMKKSAVTLADEPTNYQRGFGYFDPTLTDTSITVRWADTTGTVLPTGYILFANTTGIFSDPADGIVYPDDVTLANGTATVNISYPEADTFRFGGLTSGTSYYFKIFPYTGYGSARNYKTANFPTNTSYIMYTSTGAGAQSISVAVNEYMNGNDQTTEWAELFVQQDNLDMRGMRLRDYSTSGTTQTGLTFSNNNLWSSVPHGSFIVVLASTNTQTQDLSFSGDKTVIVSAANPTYFSGSSFNIGGSNDAVEILTSGLTHIHSLSHGTKPGNIASLPAPTANVANSSTSGNVVRFFNVSSNAQFGSDAYAQHSSIATQGIPNDEMQSNYANSALPVELMSFDAAIIQSAVRLYWQTATEVNNHGFTIERKQYSPLSQLANTHWQTVGFVGGQGTTNTPTEYQFTDIVKKLGRYSYRLKQIDRNGSVSYSQMVNATVSGTPGTYVLEQNYPNPFNPATTVAYSLPAAGFTTLKVYDALGRDVATLVNGVKEAGSYSIPFDASSLNSGMYFYTLTSGAFSATRKLLLMK